MMAAQAGQSIGTGSHAAAGEDVFMTSPPAAGAGVTFDLPADRAAQGAGDSSNASESSSRTTLFSALQEIKLSLEDLLTPRALDTPSTEDQTPASIAPFLHPFDGKTASVLGFGSCSSGNLLSVLGASQGSASTSSATVTPPLTREHLRKTLTNIRTSLDKHRARILPALFRSSSDSSSGGSIAPNFGQQPQQQTAAMTPDPNSNGGVSKVLPSILQGQQPLKERYMMLLHEQSADDATRNILTAALRDPSSSTCSADNLETKRRRCLPKELYVERESRNAGVNPRKRKIAMVEDPLDGGRSGASSSMTFPRSAMKGKSKAVDPPPNEGGSIDELNGSAGEDQSRSHSALGQFKQLTKQLEELPGSPDSWASSPTPSTTTLSLAEARILLLQLSAALSSLAQSWGLEHLEEKLDVQAAAQRKEGDKVHSHTLTIAGKVLVLDFDFWLLVLEARSWTPSIQVRVSYATFDVTTAEQQANGSGTGGDEQHGLEDLLQRSVQSLSETWLKAASGAGVEVQEQLEERYFVLEDIISTLVELDRMSSTPSGESGEAEANHGRDAFAELAFASKKLLQSLQGQGEKLGYV